MLSQSFEDYVVSLQLDNETDIDTKFKSITKRLNTSYYETNSEEEHGYKVGSVGRKTAIKGVSDMDMLFVLPDEIYKKYDKHEGNGQKELLKAVKAEIAKRYPSTTVRGDGQVVVVSFTNYEVEVCPAFAKTDGSYKYPDSNDGGKWKTTDPMVEIGESEYMIEHTNFHFKYICQMIRAWKNHLGFKMGGLLVDTLVHKFLHKYPSYQSVTFEDYLPLLKDLFYYLKGLNKEQKYWGALGSNQRVYNKSSKFINKAKDAYEALQDFDEESDDLYEALQGLFGKNFPVPQATIESFATRFAFASTEQFIEDLFPVDIKYNVRIDCEVKQNGYREIFLRKLLSEKKPLLVKKSLNFMIVDSDIEREGISHEVYWKVRNRGTEASGRERGQINKGGHSKTESTNFKGGHYVECYIIHEGVCVARDHINVPISTSLFSS